LDVDEMSLINNMLKDLDARGLQGGAALDLDVRPVARAERRSALWPLAGALGAVLALGAAGLFAWRASHRPEPVTLVPPERSVRIAAAPALPLTPATVGAGAPRIAADPAPAAPTPSAARAPRVDGARAQSGAAAPLKGERRVTADGKRAPDARQRRQQARAEHGKPAQQRKLKPGAAVESVPAASPARPSDAGNDGAPARGAPLVAGAPAGGKQQVAQAEYRRALDRLQDGRVVEAIAGLERALQADAGHDGARQTLIGLLIENKRPDEAIEALRAGLALSLRQPALAMLLARLQIERGGSGIDTLMRSLPYAQGDGQYHAFLAGALQRQRRQREAIEQYQLALKTAPRNGLWRMGLGISLQADKREAEALDAFEQAKASGTLSPELQAFVERRLQQLAR
jgi:MSHA biogenesis protein MshN